MSNDILKKALIFYIRGFFRYSFDKIFFATDSENRRLSSCIFGKETC